jgi:hypothetical protein
MRKSFDCVEMKRRAQERIVAETAGMTLEEELAYWRTQEEAWRQELRRRRKPARQVTTATH